MAKKPNDTREFTDAGVAHSRQMMGALDPNDFSTKLRKTGTGNKMMLRTKGGEPMITGEKPDHEIFLENGFIKQGSYAPLGTADELETIATASDDSTTTRYLFVKNKLDGLMDDGSNLDVDPVAYNAFYRGYTTKKSSTSPAGALTAYLDILREKNKAVRNCPAPMYTGMMRRYVAALHGMALDELAVGMLTAGSWGSLSFLGMSFDPSKSGIVWSETKRAFWLVELNRSSLRYAQMVQSEVGELCMEWLDIPDITPEQKNVVLSYILSQSYVPLNDDDAIEWRDGGTSLAIIGDTLSFGWRFNSDGTQATMTTIDNPVANHFDSRRYQASITIAEDTEIPAGNPLRFSLSVEVTKVEEVLLWTSNRIKVFYPISMGVYMWYKTGFVEGHAANAPLVSFYDDLDVVQVCRFNRTEGAESTSVDGAYTGQVLTPANTYPDFNETNVAGWGGGYSWWRKNHLIGDGAMTALGGFSGSDVRLNDHHTEAYVASIGAFGENQGATPVTGSAPVSMGYGASGVNGVENTGYAATWGFDGYMNTYMAPYTWAASGRYIGQETKVYTMMLIAPHDNATAWLECMHSGEVLATVQNLSTPADNFDNQHTFKMVGLDWSADPVVEVGPTILVQNALVNMNAQFDATPDETTGVNTTAVRNSKGRFVVASVSNTDGGAPGPFWNATVMDPVVEFDMLVQDDFNGAVTASNVMGGSAYNAGWPSPNLRSIGWQ